MKIPSGLMLGQVQLADDVDATGHRCKYMQNTKPGKAPFASEGVACRAATCRIRSDVTKGSKGTQGVWIQMVWMSGYQGMMVRCYGLCWSVKGSAKAMFFSACEFSRKLRVEKGEVARDVVKQRAVTCGRSTRNYPTQTTRLTRRQVQNAPKSLIYKTYLDLSNNPSRKP